MNPPGASKRSLIVRMSRTQHLAVRRPTRSRDLGDGMRLAVAELRDEVEDAAELGGGRVGHARCPRVDGQRRAGQVARIRGTSSGGETGTRSPANESSHRAKASRRRTRNRRRSG